MTALEFLTLPLSSAFLGMTILWRVRGAQLAATRKLLAREQERAALARLEARVD